MTPTPLIVLYSRGTNSRIGNNFVGLCRAIELLGSLDLQRKSGVTFPQLEQSLNGFFALRNAWPYCPNAPAFSSVEDIGAVVKSAKERCGGRRNEIATFLHDRGVSVVSETRCLTPTLLGELLANSTLPMILNDPFFLPVEVTGSTRSDVLRRFFEPKLLALSDFARSDDTHPRVGFHIRRGDYKRWRRGEFYYSHEYYGRLMSAAGDVPNVRIHVVSDDPIPRQISGHPLVREGVGEHLKTSLGPVNSDLLELSLCDVIVGPPSTFSSLAAHLSLKTQTRQTPVPRVVMRGKLRDEVAEIRSFL